MPARVREILEKVGDDLITKIQLGRTPVHAIVLNSLNLLSAGKFTTKKIELGYDQIYHNYLLLTIKRSKGPSALHSMIKGARDKDAQQILKLEKAHRVRLVAPVYPEEFVDLYDIPLSAAKSYTLNRLITIASNVDKHFFTYDAGDNNMCQTFVENIIDINGLTGNIVDEATRVALKAQDARTLVATLGSRRDIVKGVTDLGGKLDKLIYDRQFVWKKPLTKEFNVVGSMHVKTIDHAHQDQTTEIQPNGTNTLVIDGASDTIVENTDEIYRAALAMEADDKKKSATQTMIILGATLLVLAGAALTAYLLWEKRQRMNNDRNKIIGSNSSSTQRTSISTTSKNPRLPLWWALENVSVLNTPNALSCDWAWFIFLPSLRWNQLTTSLERSNNP